MIDLNIVDTAIREAAEELLIDENDVVVDVGAHIGLFALYASQFCNNGKIYSFEPVKENYDLLINDSAS